MGLLDRFRSKSKRDTSYRTGVDIERRFDILRTAVSGSMSKFFKAHDRETERLVGVKVADSDKTKLFESRFRALKKPSEGKIGLSIDHPHVVTTYEHGLTRGKDSYIMMEFLEGPGLHILIYENDQQLAGKRLNMIRQMAEALQGMHDAGFIHRDICPRNFICNPELDAVTLFDFGLTLPDRHAFHQPGNRTGTPLYMAPEVVRRKWTDHRLDIFAFGVTCYELCSFTLPWPKTDTTGMAALAHDTETPENLLTHCPGLNKKLAAAIMKCMEADADNRFATVNEFLKAISKCQSEEE